MASLGEEPRNSERVGRLTSYLDTILFTENSVQNFTEKGPGTLGPPLNMPMIIMVYFLY